MRMASRCGGRSLVQSWRHIAAPIRPCGRSGNGRARQPPTTRRASAGCDCRGCAWGAGRSVWQKPANASKRASRSGSPAARAPKTGPAAVRTPTHETVPPSCWNDMRRLGRSQTMGPSASSHLVPRTMSYPARGMTKRSTRNGAPAMSRGTSQMTPAHVIRSPLATMAVRRGR